MVQVSWVSSCKNDQILNFKCVQSTVNCTSVKISLTANDFPVGIFNGTSDFHEHDFSFPIKGGNAYIWKTELMTSLPFTASQVSEGRWG